MLNRALDTIRRHFRSNTVSKPGDWQERTYSEKISWRCLNPDPSVDYVKFVDKHHVKSAVEGLFDVPKNYQVVSGPEQIDIASLPPTFVMKATHGWDMSLLVEEGIVAGSNRSTEHAGKEASEEFLKQIAQEWFQSEKEEKRQERQKHYQLLKKRLLFEQYIDPVDYELQLFLFNGHYKFAMVLYRSFSHFDTTHQLYDENWSLMGPGSEEFVAHYESNKGEIQPPPSELLTNLQFLTEGMDHVRADFFVSKNQYYFSEFTFTHNGGRGPGFIGKYDKDLGFFWDR